MDRMMNKSWCKAQGTTDNRVHRITFALPHPAPCFSLGVGSGKDTADDCIHRTPDAGAPDPRPTLGGGAAQRTAQLGGRVQALVPQAAGGELCWGCRGEKECGEAWVEGKTVQMARAQRTAQLCGGTCFSNPYINSHVPHAPSSPGPHPPNAAAAFSPRIFPQMLLPRLPLA